MVKFGNAITNITLPTHGEFGMVAYCGKDW